MIEIVKHEDGTLEYPVWWRTGGGGLVRRDCLDHDHPQQTYNYLKTNGITPEDYGVYHGNTERAAKFRDWSHAKLVARIMELEDEIVGYQRAGF